MPLESHRIPSRDLDLHALSNHPRPSPTPPILAIHGFFDHARTFLPILDHIPHPATLLDRRGCGDSPHLSQGRYDLALHLIDIHHTLDAIAKPPRAILIGHSIGGIIATIYAGAFPERIRALILLDIFGARPTHPAEQTRDAILSQLEDPPPPKRYPSADDALARLRANHPRIPPDILEAWGRAGITTHPDGQASFKSDPRHRGRELLLSRPDIVIDHAQRIAAPTLALRGADSLIPRFPDWLSALPDLRTETIPEAGHMLHLEQARATGEAIARFIASLPEEP